MTDIDDADVDYAAALIDQNAQLGLLLEAADWSIPVPTCPDWTLLQLMRHVGRGDRWAAQIVRERSAEPVDLRSVPDGKPPDDPTGAVEWLSAGPTILLDAVNGVGTQTQVWTFVGPRPAEWWIRRRLHEATVHRADAAIAIDASYDLESWLAADAISEWLDLAAVMDPDPSEVIELRASDVSSKPSDWHIGDALAQPEVVVSGTAVDLLLTIFHRRSSTGVTVTGDGQPWRNWLDRTSF